MDREAADWFRFDLGEESLQGRAGQLLLLLRREGNGGGSGEVSDRGGQFSPEVPGAFATALGRPIPR